MKIALENEFNTKVFFSISAESHLVIGIPFSYTCFMLI